jgi:hypothetical protein
MSPPVESIRSVGERERKGPPCPRPHSDLAVSSCPPISHSCRDLFCCDRPPERNSITVLYIPSELLAPSPDRLVLCPHLASPPGNPPRAPTPSLSPPPLITAVESKSTTSLSYTHERSVNGRLFNTGKVRSNSTIVHCQPLTRTNDDDVPLGTHCDQRLGFSPNRPSFFGPDLPLRLFHLIHLSPVSESDLIRHRCAPITDPLIFLPPPDTCTTATPATPETNPLPLL